MALQAAAVIFLGCFSPLLVLSFSFLEGDVDTEPQAERPAVVDTAVSSHDLTMGAIAEALKKQMKRNVGGGTQELAHSLGSYSAYEDTGAASTADAQKRKEHMAEELARHASRRAAAIHNERVRHGAAMQNIEKKLHSKIDDLHRREDQTFAAEHKNESELRQGEQELRRIAQHTRGKKRRRPT